MSEKTLGQRLVLKILKLAEQADISQKELLKRANVVGTTAFIDWKNGTTSPPVDKLEMLCAVIGRKLTVSIGAEAVAGRQAPELDGEALEAAEHIMTLDSEADRIAARDSLIRYIRTLHAKQTKTGG